MLRSAVGVETESVLDPRPRAMPLAEPPARALPYRIAPHLGLDLGLTHPGIVVPGEVVGAHMLEAEPQIPVQFEPRFGRAEIAADLATGVVARAHRRLRHGRENGIDRLAAHGAQYGSAAAA
jgi:hypothetical protein